MGMKSPRNMKKKQRNKKKREFVIGSDEDVKNKKYKNKKKRMKIQKNFDEQMKKNPQHPFHLNSSRREGQKFKLKFKKNSHSLPKLYDEEIQSNSSFREHNERIDLL